MKRKKTKTDIPFENGVTLPDAAGRPVLSFPYEAAEQLRYMLARIKKGGKLPARVAIFSALRGEGVTYTAHALASVLAHDFGDKVCLIDMNWHWPPDEHALWVGIDVPQTGLADVVKGEVPLEQALLASGWPNLSFLPAGTLKLNERTIMAHSDQLEAVLDQLAQRFDILIFDIPAILSTSDAVLLAALADACFFVIRQDASQEQDVKRALNEVAGLPIQGAILNRVHFYTPRALLKALAEN